MHEDDDEDSDDDKENNDVLLPFVKQKCPKALMIPQDVRNVVLRLYFCKDDGQRHLLDDVGLVRRINDLTTTSGVFIQNWPQLIAASSLSSLICPSNS